MKSPGRFYLLHGSRGWGPFKTEKAAWNHLREHNPGRKKAAFLKAGYTVTEMGVENIES